VKRYKFQALVTLGPRQDPGPDTVLADRMRRMVVRGQHHATGGSRFFSALVRKSGDSVPWPEDQDVLVTVVLVGDEPRDYFDIGDTFALWLGNDLGRGIVTRRLFM